MTDNLTARILRDMEDSVIVISKEGRVTFANNRARSLLELDDLPLEDSAPFAEVFHDWTESDNSEFFDLLIQAIVDKKAIHQKTLCYTRRDGRVLTLFVRSGFLTGGEGSTDGVILIFTDVTERAELEKKNKELETERSESAFIFTILMAGIIAFLFCCFVLSNFGIEIPSQILSHIVEALAVIFFLIIRFKTHYKVFERGLKYPGNKIMILDVLISVVMFALILSFRILFIWVDEIQLAWEVIFNFGNIPAWRWTEYLVTAVIQETMMHVMIQELLEKLYRGSKAVMAAALISPIIFAGLHIPFGLTLTLGALAVSLATNLIYAKQRSIWGCVIMHYVLGMGVTIVGF